MIMVTCWSNSCSSCVSLGVTTTESATTAATIAVTVTTNTYREQRHHITTAVATIDRRVSLHNTSPLTSMLQEVDVRESPDDQFTLFHGMGHYAITRPHAVYSATDTQHAATNMTKPLLRDHLYSIQTAIVIASTKHNDAATLQTLSCIKAST